MQQHVERGNAAVDGRQFRGWFVGHFLDGTAGARSTDAVEVKWGSHVAGEARSTWAVSEAATTLSVLLRGRFRLYFPDDQEVLLAREGDYALWPPGVAHRWNAEQDALVVTVRWPSRSGDARVL